MLHADIGHVALLTVWPHRWQCGLRLWVTSSAENLPLLKKPARASSGADRPKPTVIFDVGAVTCSVAEFFGQRTWVGFDDAFHGGETALEEMSGPENMSGTPLQPA